MTAIDVPAIRDLWVQADNAATADAKGKALEDLVCVLFERVPGISVTQRNAMNAFLAEEVDVAFWNDQNPGGLQFFDFIILVECKNWNARVGSDEISSFNQKLQSRGRPFGIFVAASGITGTPEAVTRAHSSLAQALLQGREIVVLTRREIEALTDTDELVVLLKKKRAQLAVSGTIFEAN
jgi:hypothetical protein